MPWKKDDLIAFDNLNTKSGLVFDIRDSEFGGPETVPGGLSWKRAIQAAICRASSLGGRVLITQGVYHIHRPLVVFSNCTIEWDSGATIITTPDFVPKILVLEDPPLNEGGPVEYSFEEADASPNDWKYEISHKGGMIIMRNAENVCLINPQLRAKETPHTPSSTGSFSGIYAEGTRGVVILGGKILNTPPKLQTDSTGHTRPQDGDGIYLTHSYDLSSISPGIWAAIPVDLKPRVIRGKNEPCDSWRIYGCELQDCGRNGLSFISARNSVVDGLIVTGCGYCGIDVEPHRVEDRDFALHIQNCVLSDNYFYGISLGRNDPASSSNVGAFILSGNTIQFTKGKLFGDEQSGTGLNIRDISNVVVVGNILRTNGVERPNDHFGIVVTNASQITFVANHVVGQRNGGEISISNANDLTRVGNVGF